jgi:hypothetical protein
MRPARLRAFRIAAVMELRGRFNVEAVVFMVLSTFLCPMPDFRFSLLFLSGQQMGQGPVPRYL